MADATDCFLIFLFIPIILLFVILTRIIVRHYKCLANISFILFLYLMLFITILKMLFYNISMCIENKV